MFQNKFTAIFQQDEDWWIGWIAEVPGAHTQGRTLAEARENLKEALELILQCNREEAMRRLLPGEVIEEDLTLVVA